MQLHLAASVPGAAADAFKGPAAVGCLGGAQEARSKMPAAPGLLGLDLQCGFDMGSTQGCNLVSQLPHLPV